MKNIICFILVLINICIPIFAEYKIDTNKVEKALGSEFNEYIGNQTAADVDVEKGFKSLLNNAKSVFKSSIKKAIAGSLSIVVCSVLISVVKSFSDISGSAISVKLVDYTGALIIIIITLLPGGSLIQECFVAINNIKNFSKILTPVYALAAAIGKHPLTAVSTASATLIFTNILSVVATNIILPIIIFYAVIYSAGVVCESTVLIRLCDLLKWCIVTFLKVIMIIFTGYISLSGIVSSSGDALAVKTAKTVISNAVPIVGSIIADSTDTLLAGIGVVKTGVGVFGILGVCAICLLPFIKCLSYFLIYKVVSAVSGSFFNASGAKAIDGITTAYSLSLATLGSCCAVQYISIIISASVTAL